MFVLGVREGTFDTFDRSYSPNDTIACGLALFASPALLKVLALVASGILRTFSIGLISRIDNDFKSLR